MLSLSSSVSAPVFRVKVGGDSRKVAAGHIEGLLGALLGFVGPVKRV